MSTPTVKLNNAVKGQKSSQGEVSNWEQGEASNWESLNYQL